MMKCSKKLTCLERTFMKPELFHYHHQQQQLYQQQQQHKHEIEQKLVNVSSTGNMIIFLDLRCQISPNVMQPVAGWSHFCISRLGFSCNRLVTTIQIIVTVVCFKEEKKHLLFDHIILNCL